MSQVLKESGISNYLISFLTRVTRLAEHKNVVGIVSLGCNKTKVSLHVLTGKMITWGEFECSPMNVKG